MPRYNVELRNLAEQFADSVATRAELVKLGLDPSTPARRCRYGTPWRRLLPGVYLLTGGEPTRRQLVRAALLRAGPIAAVTGLEAARRLGVRRLPEDPHVHILVPAGIRTTSRGFLVVERTNRRWDERRVDGFPLVTAPRALIDHARREHRLDVVRAMVADAVQRNICSIDDLVSELRLPRLRGTAIPRRVMHEVGAGVRSVAEAWARTLVRRSHLPEPAWNVLLRSRTGRLLGVVDGWWDEIGLAWEIDSKEFHLSPADYEETLTRHSRLAAAGVLVVHTVPSRIRRDPLGVIRELSGAYEFASRRPRPPILTEQPTRAA
jgi:hypothetical protein